MDHKTENTWKVRWRQKALSIAVAVLIGLLFTMAFFLTPSESAKPVPKNVGEYADLASPEELWFVRFEKEVQKLKGAFEERENVLKERIAQQEERFMRESRALEEALISLKVPQENERLDRPMRRQSISVHAHPMPSRDVLNVRLCAGAIAYGSLLSGVDAKAGVSASADPHPVIIVLTSGITLPGNTRLPGVQHCHVTGSGYGDISSERVYIRLEKMSCEGNDGEIIETTVAGFVVGSDGRAGVRGRMAMRDGKLLMRGFWGGVLSGISSILSKPSPVLLTAGQGVQRAGNYTQFFQEGMHKAGSGALERLSSYYLERAEQMQPVIQISSGQKVSVVFHKGTQIGSENVHKDIERDRQEAHQHYLTDGV